MTILTVVIIVAGWIAACLLFLLALYMNFRRDDRGRAEACRERIVAGLFDDRDRGCGGRRYR